MLNCFHRPNQHQAFTLAELLISLAILGVIATFTIPKILSAVNTTDKYTIWKTEIATLSQLVYTYSLTPQSDTLKQYILNHVNYTKLCPNNVLAEGCRTVPTDHTATDARPGYITHSGALVTLTEWPNAKASTITIDYNGDSPPNIASEIATTDHDHLGLQSNGDSSILNMYSLTLTGEPWMIPPGQILPWIQKDWTYLSKIWSK